MNRDLQRAGPVRHLEVIGSFASFHKIKNYPTLIPHLFLIPLCTTVVATLAFVNKSIARAATTLRIYVLLVLAAVAAVELMNTCDHRFLLGVDVLDAPKWYSPTQS
jgi:hypothetical protein